jgi:hypothetical protein
VSFNFGREKMSDEPDKPALDEWAQALVGLGEGIVAELIRSIQRLADDRRLPVDDRSFAESQVAALRRAIRAAGPKRKSDKNS